jgi:hypothetical protein
LTGKEEGVGVGKGFDYIIDDSALQCIRAINANDCNTHLFVPIQNVMDQIAENNSNCYLA